MEREEQRPPSKPSQMAEEGWSYTPEQRRAIMTATQMLSSGTLDEESFRLMEQLTSRTRHQPTAAVPGSGSNPGPVQQTAPPGGTRTEAEPSEERALERSEAEPSSGDLSDEPAEAGVVVGSLRATQEDKWACKVPSCTGSFHRLKDCRIFHGMEPEDRVKLVEHHKLCLGCLTPGHGRAARSCPYKGAGGRMPKNIVQGQTSLPPTSRQAQSEGESGGRTLDSIA
jgi:hypothetical protein